METEMVMEITKKAILISVYLAGPMLGTGLLIGLLVSIFQTTTQIQEQTLTFIPKVLSIILTIVYLGPWMMGKMQAYTINILGQLHKFVN
jgi:flagellar biosynthetic protein FliQ